MYRISSVKVEYTDINGHVLGFASTQYKTKPICNTPESIFQTVEKDIKNKIAKDDKAEYKYTNAIVTVATNRGSFKRYI